MKTRILSVVVVGLLASSAYAFPTATKSTTGFGQNVSTTPSKPVNINDVSFAFGFTMGSNMKRQKMELNVDQFVKGMREALAGKKAKQSKEEMMKTLMQYQRQVMKKRVEGQKVAGEKNKKEGEAFLASNKSKPGVVTLPSGLQYKIISKGSGAKPTLTDKVKVTYSGKLLNGEVFSSSDDPTKPATFTLNQVVPAWKEALQLMHKGAKWELFVPAKLAYGARGARGDIGPNATLIFTIHLLDFEKQTGSNSPQTQFQKQK